MQNVEMKWIDCRKHNKTKWQTSEEKVTAFAMEFEGECRNLKPQQRRKSTNT